MDSLFKISKILQIVLTLLSMQNGIRQQGKELLYGAIHKRRRNILGVVLEGRG